MNGPPSNAIDRIMLLSYLDQRREHADRQVTIAAANSRDEVYWMGVWTELTSIRNAVFTRDYNQAVDVHHRGVAPKRRTDR